jgi:hypothetical protein
MDRKAGEYEEELVGRGRLGWKVSVPQLTTRPLKM